MSAVQVTYYSDVLCIWAYVAQARVDAIKDAFGRDVTLDFRFCSVFGDARGKLETNWKDRGGLDGYAAHVRGIAQRFPHVKLHPGVWSATVPASSTSPHVFLKALLAWERETRPGANGRLPIYESVAWAMRRGFFEEARDISLWQVQCQLAAPFGVPLDEIERRIENGSAFARLSADYAEAEKTRIEGSPTFVLNEGRQKFFGNVGFRVIDVNIRELLKDPTVDQASWC